MFFRIVRKCTLVTIISALPVLAQQQPRAYTAADYDSAAKYLGGGLGALVVGGTVQANWLPDERFWYVSTTTAGSQVVLVNPVSRTRAPAFDHARVAAALTSAGGGQLTAQQMATQQLTLSPRADTVIVTVAGNRFACDVRGNRCAAVPAAAADTGGRGGAPGRGARGGGGGVAGRGGGRAGGGGGAPVNMSADGTKGAFIRDWNLWVRDIATGTETQLTEDGQPNFGYATDNAGWTGSAAAILLWSPDSKKIATQQQDERKVGEMYLVSTSVGHPTLRAWKYPLPGDSNVAMLHHVIIDVASRRTTRLQLPPQFHRATLGDDISMNDYNWSPDATKLALVSTSRDHKSAIFRIADATTGAVKTIFEEKVATHFEARTGWRVLWNRNEIIWYSQKDDWGHLYLHDLNTGQLKNSITSGEGPVTSITRMDTAARVLWFAANGRERGQDPYYRHYYRVGLDGQNYVSLTPDDGDHTMTFSPSGKYIIDSYSTPQTPPTVALRDGVTGALLVPLEKADISRLLATGWRAPMSVKMKSADGKFDIYGMLFRPTKFDSTRRYPIINQIYPGPQSGSVGSRAFTTARGDRQALAELGFIVVSIDGSGTPGRSKAFHDNYYGAMGRHNTIPDQMAGMKELAARHSWIDINRTGIWGHSGGGFATSSAMFRYPDFWKVGISESGNHDQRNYEDDWGERYQGLLGGNVGPGDTYDVEGNQNFAKDLKGKLMLAHGGMDNNVPPSNTMLVVERLIAANKDFDLVIFPNAGHGFGAAGNYMMRKRWDYFVKHLLGAEPPKEYVFPAAGGGRAGGRGGVN